MVALPCLSLLESNVFIVYTKPGEVLITTPENESDFLEDMFMKCTGRHLDDYRRSEIPDNGVVTTFQSLRAN